MPYQPYQSTWQNPYLPPNSTTLPYQAQPYQQPVNGIVKVNGRDSAMQYQLPPNSMSPALFDSNGKVFYVVSTDGTGTKSIETFDFTPHVEESPVVVDGVEFASKSELDELAAKVAVIMEVINGSDATVSTADTASSARAKHGIGAADGAQADGKRQP